MEEVQKNLQRCAIKFLYFNPHLSRRFRKAPHSRRLHFKHGIPEVNGLRNSTRLRPILACGVVTHGAAKEIFLLETEDVEMRTADA